MQFAGQYLDSESGEYYMRARYYDPLTGQFISRDPRVATSKSPYGYVSNSPANGIDPSGALGLGLCGSLNGMLAILNLGGTGCLEDIQNGTTTETGAIGLPFFGLGVGLNIGGTVAVQVSNANYLVDLCCWFDYFTVSGEYAAGASITVWSTPPWQWGSGTFIYGGDIGPSFGAGADIAGGLSYTWVHRFGSWQAAAVNAYVTSNVTDPIQKLGLVRRLLEQRGIDGSPRPEPC